MVLETAASVGLVGFALGWLAGRRQSDERPMRLVRRYETTAPAQAAQPFDELESWRQHVTSFAFHANLLGSFSYRTMREAGVCRRKAWEVYVAALKAEGVLASTERSATSWAGGWCYSRLRVALKHQLIAPPYPSGSPPAINSGHLAAQMAQGGAAHTVSAGIR